MGYATGLPAALARRGLQVEVVPGWQTRGSSAFAPRGAVCHWTAGPRTGDRPSLNVVVNGRPGVPGPLANVFLTRGGVAIVVAAGRANHAGEGGWRGLVGNSTVFGTEAENSGGGEWTDAQRRAYPRINAAYADLGGFGVEMICGHSEWTSRKIDIRDWDMPAMRAQVAAVIAGGDEDMTPEQDAALAAIFRAIPRITQILEAVDVRTGNAKGNLAVAAKQIGEIHGVVNFARRPDGTPFKIAVQGDVETILAAIAGVESGGSVDAEALASALIKALGPKLTAEVQAALSGLTATTTLSRKG